MRKVLFISLGCDKNLADSEEMLGMLVENGYTLTNDETEAEGMLEYDYILINDVIEDCVDNMHNIIQSQHDAVKNRQEFIKEITEEIAVFKKGE